MDAAEEQVMDHIFPIASKASGESRMLKAASLPRGSFFLYTLFKLVSNIMVCKLIIVVPVVALHYLLKYYTFPK